jgi:uncharacterized membrane protein YebE (DUF533 family)
MKKKIAGGVGQGEVDAQVLQKTNKKQTKKNPENKTKPLVTSITHSRNTSSSFAEELIKHMLL